MKTPIKPFEISSHIDQEEILASYLTEAAATGDPAILLEAMGIVAKAMRMVDIAEETGLQRVGLYKALSANGNPKLSTFFDLISAMGLAMKFSAKQEEQRPNSHETNLMKRTERRILSKTIKQARAETRRCLNPHCQWNASAVLCHQLSQSQLSQISKDNKVIIGRPIEDKILFKDQYQLYTESPIRRALQYKGFCSKCDNSLFVKLDNPENHYSPNIVIAQAYRSLTYHMIEEKIFYEARKLYFDELGIVSSARPTFETKDRRVAKNLEEEWQYLEAGYLYYKEEIEKALKGNASEFEIVIHKIKEKLPIRFVSSTHLNVDLFDMPNDLDWGNSGKIKPLIFWQLLQFEGQTYLSYSVLKRHKKIAKNIFSQLESLASDKRLSYFFRYASANNFGFAMNPNEFNKYAATETFVSDIEKYVEGLRKHQRIFDWQKYAVPTNLGTLSFQ